MLKRISTYLSLLILLLPFASYAASPVGTDSRIRTFVYGPNDVFRVITSYGYQTIIEFEEDEKIKTISVGNSGFFRITPMKNKIILRGLQSNQLTNATVLTSKRTYQFEFSTMINTLDDVMYAVRFYYPENFGGVVPVALANANAVNPSDAVPEVRINSPVPSSASAITAPPLPNIMQQPTPMMNYNPIPQAPAPIIPPVDLPPQQMPQLAPQAAPSLPAAQPGSFNYNYSLTGKEELSPTEVFDDSSRIYFKFNNSMTPSFKFVNPAGGEVPANYQISDNYYVVEGIAPQINVYFGSDRISIFNDSYGAR